MTRPTVLVWLDAAPVYRAAAERAGLGERVELVTIAGDATTDPGELARADALVAWRLPSDVLHRMPRLRWIQALTAGVEGWLVRSDLAPGVALTCARGTHRVQMPENILGALFHLTKPYAEIAPDRT